MSTQTTSTSIKPAKALLCSLLAFVLAVGLVPAMPHTSYAAEAEDVPTAASNQAHVVEAAENSNIDLTGMAPSDLAYRNVPLFANAPLQTTALAANPNEPVYGSHEWAVAKYGEHTHTASFAPGTELTATTYFIAESTGIEVTSTKGGQNGLTVKNNTTIVLETGSSLKAKGGNGADTTHGGTGINVPFGKTLVFEGDGEVTAIGGDGTKPSSGYSGTRGVGTPEDNDYLYSQAGRGGSGGAAAGPAIGGVSGNAGAGATAPLLKQRYLNNSAGSWNTSGLWGYTGLSGYGGGDGVSGNAAGTASFRGKVALGSETKAGTSFSNVYGSGGGSAAASAGKNWAGWACAVGAGGGGGGGGGAGPAPTFGGGAGGGAGGGSGSTGNLRGFNPYKEWGVGGNGGGGGGGYAGGSGGIGGTPSTPVKNAYSWYGNYQHLFNGENGFSGSDRGYPGDGGEVTTKSSNYDVANQIKSAGDGGTAGSGGGYGTVTFTIVGATSSGVKQSGLWNPEAGTSAVQRVFPADECVIRFTDTPTAADGASWLFTGSDITPNFEVVHAPTGQIVPVSTYNTIWTANSDKTTSKLEITSKGLVNNEKLDTSIGGNLVENLKILFDVDDAEVVLSGVRSGTTNWITYTGNEIKPVTLRTTSTKTLIPVSAYQTQYVDNTLPGIDTAKYSFELTADKWQNENKKDTLEGVFSIVEVPTITSPDTLYNAAVGTEYNYQLTATMRPDNANDTIVWALDSGSLPNGLSLAADGTVSGNPTAKGTFTVVVSATNKAGTTTKTITWKIGDLSGTAFYMRNNVKNPVPNATITAYEAGTANSLGTTTTAADGTYSFADLANKANKVDVEFTTPDGKMYRVKDTTAGANKVTNVGLTTASTKTTDMEFDRAVNIGLNVGVHGSFADIATAQQSGFPGDLMTLPKPDILEEGYGFEGWFDGEADTASKAPARYPEIDATYYAHYGEVRYEVVYVTPSDADQVAAREVKFGVADLIPSPDPKRPGYVFKNWYYQSTAGKVVVGATTTYSSLVGSDSTVKSITLQSEWTETTIDMTLQANGSAAFPATIDGDSSKLYPNLTYRTLVDYPAPVRDGFSFVGWSEMQNYDPATHDAQYKPIMSIAAPGFNTTYYAQWQAKDVGVTFDAMGGTFAQGVDGKFNGKPGTSGTIPQKPDREGYTFLGWYNTPTAGDQKYAPTDTAFTYPVGTTYFYAHWKPAEVSLKLTAGKGAPDVQIIPGIFGTTVSYALPMLSGHSFKGWKLPDGTTSMFISFPAQDATYEADWVAGQSTVAFNPMNGSFEADESGLRPGSAGDTYTLPVNPTRTGYSFGGWYTTPEYNQEMPTGYTIPAQSVTYYAKWAPKKISVVLNSPGATPETQTGKQNPGDFGSVIEYDIPSKKNAAFVGWKLPGADDSTATMFPTYPAQDNAVYEAVFEDGVVSVVFNPMDGKFPAGEDGRRTGKEGDAYSKAIEKPAKTGHTFEGWYTDPTGGVEYTGQTFTSASNTIYYARWTPNTIKLTFDAGSEAKPVTQTKEGPYGSVVGGLDTPLRDGYTFMGWKFDTQLDSEAVKAPKFLDTAATMQAVWAPNSISITYDMQGGTLDSGNLVNAGLPDGDYTIPATTRVGYDFDGWFTLPLGGSPMQKEGVAKLPGVSATYYAHWSAKVMQVTLNAGAGGSPSAQSASGDFGTVIKYALPKKDNNAFVGWKKDGSSTAAEMFPLFGSNDNATYSAQWAPGQANVTYDPDGGRFLGTETGSFTGKTGESYNRVVPNPERTGYDFAGWWTERGGMGSKYTSTTYPSTSNTVVYAKWVPHRVEVTFEANYVGAPAPEKVNNLTYGQAVNYTQPGRVGYAFLGWSTTPDNLPPDATYAPTAPAANATLYAQWKQGQVNVRFDALGGSFKGSDSGVRTGFAGATGLLPPENPTKNGYIFKGWFSDSAATSAADTTTFPLKDATYYAKWEADSITVILKANNGTFADGSAISKPNATFGQNLAYEIPKRPGYAFTGWRLEGTQDAPQTSLLVPSSAHTYEAVWVAHEIIVTYDYTGGALDSKGSVQFKGEPNSTYTQPDSTKLVREGYTCTGFYTAPTGGTLVNANALPTENATYFAQWTPRTNVEVKFNLAGGMVGTSGTPQTLSGTFGQAIKAPEPTLAGRTFLGWILDGAAASTATKYLVFPAKNTTYTAVWGDAAESSVTYNAMGGTIANGAAWTKTDKTGASYTSPEPDARPGYTFVGWAASADPSVAIDHDKNIARKIPAAPASYFAQWTQDTYKVTLDYLFGSPATQEVEGHLGEAISYSVPARPGFTFKGWVDASIQGVVSSITPKFSADNKGKTLSAVWEAATITVVFNATGGVGDASFSGTAEQTYAAPANPTRKGYTFDKWTTKADGTGDVYAPADPSKVAFDPTASAVWYAQWIQKNITVTLDAKEGTIAGNQSKNYEGHYGDTMSYDEPARPGYSFMGWQVSGQSVKHLSFPDDNATYSAVWSADNSTVTFDLNAEGARFVGEQSPGVSETGMRTGSTDASVTPSTSPASDPERTGYEFSGWYNDEACTLPATSFAATYPAGGITYWAGWQIKHPTVELSAPSATNGQTLQALSGDWASPIPYQLPDREGYTFEGWSVKDPITGALGAPQMQPTFPEENTVYVASWKEGTVVVRFDAAGGTFKSPETGVRTGNPNSSFALPASNAIEKSGYTFKGWFSSPVGGVEITGTQTMPARGTIYYAHWEAQDITVNLDANGGDTLTVTSKTGKFGAALSYDMPTRSGFTFTGWSKSVNNNPDTKTMFPVFDLALHNQTLYAQWVADAVEISFIATPGTPNSSQSIKVSESYTVPQDPTRIGYTFAGWFDAASGGTSLGKQAGDTVNVSTAGNVVWYAQWTPNKVKVVFDAGAGATLDNSAQTKEVDNGKFGEPANYGADPTKSGYTFKGWKLHASPERPDNEASSSITFPAADATYDAVWAKNDVILVLDANDGKFGAGALSTVSNPGPAGDVFTMPADKAVREGYTLKGWYTLPKGGTQVIAPDAASAKLPASSRTYYAQWDANAITVTLNATNADTYEKQTPSGKFGEIIKYDIPTKAGAGFIGWQAQGSSNIEAFPTYPVVATTYEAVFGANVSTVLFNPMGGEFEKVSGATDNGIRSGAAGSEYDKPELKSRDGYLFEGWYTQPDGTGASLEDSKGTTAGKYLIPTSDTIYYAHWTADNTTITLDANGGELPNLPGSPVGSRTETGKTGALIDYQRQGVPTRAGFGFMGWSIDKNAPSGDLFPVYPTKVIQGTNDTLYAIWEAGSTTIAFRAQGGTLSTGGTDFTVSGAPQAAYDVPKATRVGYTFEGWYPDPVDRSISGPTAGTSEKMPIANTTYYAHWTPQPIGGIAVSLDWQDNVNVKVAPRGNHGTLIAYDYPVREGYTFKGWSTAAGSETNLTKYPLIDAALVPVSTPGAYTLYAAWETNKVSITYDATTGSGGAFVDKVQAGSYYSIPTDPVRTGYKFAGWFTLPVGGSEHQVDANASNGEDKAPTKDTVYYAQWTPLKVSVTFDADGGAFASGNTTLISAEGEVGSTLNYEVPTRKGQVFKGWADQSGSSSGEFSVTYPAKTPSGADPVATYYAVWVSASPVTTQYYPQGGSLDGKQPDDGLPGETFTAPGATRTGYTFKGWTTTADENASVVHQKGASVERTKDAFTAYYAKWEAIPLTAKLMLNDGTSTEFASPTGTLGKPIDYDLPAREGYTFVGWANSATAVAADAEMSPVFSNPSAGGSAITLYAIWQKGKATVSFFGQGGEDHSYTQEVGTQVEVPSNPSRPGYSFDCWYTDKNCTSPANVFATNQIEVGPEANKAYWAGWTVAQAAVTLMLNDGTNEEHTSSQGNFGNPVNYVAPERAGYTFKGWSEDSKATSGELSLAYSDTNKTYYAVWSPDIITVSFEAQGGKLVGNAQVSGKVGDLLVAPTNPTREGYTFKGWSLKPNATNQADIATVPSKLPSTSAIYFAQWTQNEIDITLKLEGGTIGASGDDVVKRGFTGDRVVYDAPTRERYVFKGWRTSSQADADAQMYLSYPSGKTTYYAAWARADLSWAYYYALGGKLVGNASYNNKDNDSYKAPDATPPAGYTFVGWSKDPNSQKDVHNAGAQVTFSKSLITTTNYYALYAPKQGISVNLDANGGKTIDGQDIQTISNLTFNQEIAYVAPERSGHVFMGWATSADATQANMALTTPASDTVYYAVWMENAEANYHSVVYQGNGGVVKGEVLYRGEATDTYTAPEVELRAGYRFKGWTTSPLSSDIAHEANASVAIGDALQTTYYASWEIASDIVVTLSPNGGTLNGSTEKVVYANQTFGSAVVYDVPVKEGYLFMGWSTDAAANIGNANIIVPEQNVTYYAVWMDQATSVKPASVFFDAMGGQLIGLSSVTGVVGAPFTSPVAERAGYTFEGWSDTPKGNVVLDGEEQSTFDAEGTKTYYARFAPRTDITITLDSAEGALVGPSVLKNQTYLSSVSLEVPTRADYIFLGWQSADTTQAPTTRISVPAQDSTYRAIWTIKPAEADASVVIYDAQGGSVSATNPLVGVAGKSYTAPVATRAGYNFMGWSATPQASVIDHAGNTSRTFPSTSPVTYFAVWEVLTDVNVVVKFDDGLGAKEEAYPNQTPGDLLEPNAPVRDGYTFVGWVPKTTRASLAANLELAAVLGQAGQSPSSVIVVPVEDAEYEAVWAKNVEAEDVRIALFNAQGTTLVAGASSVISGLAGDTFSLPQVQAREGFEFTGWLSSVDNKLYQVDETPTYPIDTTHVVFTAQWKAVEVEVTLEAGDFATPKTQTIKGGIQAVVDYEVPQAIGKQFRGWKVVDADDSTAVRDLMFPQTNATYVAVWIDLENVESRFYLEGGEATSIQGGQEALSAAQDLGYVSMSGLPKAEYVVPSATKQGYVFKGWALEPGGEVVHAANARVKYADSPVSMFFAVWEALPYEVTLDPQNGEAAKTITGEMGQSIRFDVAPAPELPVREGYSFVGWARADSLENLGMFPVLSDDLNHKTLKALWRVGAASVVFFTGDAAFDEVLSGTPAQSFTVPADPTRAGYTFKGWFSDEGLTQPAGIKANESYPYANVANTLYWAAWEANAIEVVLDPNGGDGAQLRKVGTYQQNLSYEMPQRSGYAFSGWARERTSNDTTLSLRFPESSQVYYAQWKPQNITVIFEPMGGTVSGQSEFTGRAGDPYSMPANPVRAGYSFKGWSTKPASVADVPTATLPQKDTIYFALWADASVKVEPGTNTGGAGASGSGSSTNWLNTGSGWSNWSGSASSPSAGSAGSASASVDGQQKGMASGKDGAAQSAVDNFSVNTSMAGGGGSIKLREENGKRTFMFTPHEGYRISAVIIDGKQIEVEASGYLMAEAEGEHTIDAVFALAIGGPVAAFEIMARQAPAWWLVLAGGTLVLGAAGGIGIYIAIRRRKPQADNSSRTV